MPKLAKNVKLKRIEVFLCFNSFARRFWSTGTWLEVAKGNREDKEKGSNGEGRNRKKCSIKYRECST